MPFIFTPISDTFLQKSRYATTLPQKSQQKIKIRFHSSAEESAKIKDTLPQKSQHKIKIRYHSSAEESAKNQDTIPLFRRRVSKKSRYASTLPQKSQQKVKIHFHSSAEESVFQAGVDAYSPPPKKKYIFYGVDAYSPNLISHWWGWRIFPHIKSSWGLKQFPQSWVIMWSKVFPMLGCAWWCIVPRDSQNLCMCFLLFLLFNG